jgi:hypothetical protein
MMVTRTKMTAITMIAVSSSAAVSLLSAASSLACVALKVVGCEVDSVEEIVL